MTIINTLECNIAEVWENKTLGSDTSKRKPSGV